MKMHYINASLPVVFSFIAKVIFAGKRVCKLFLKKSARLQIVMYLYPDFF